MTKDEIKALENVVYNRVCLQVKEDKEINKRNLGNRIFYVLFGLVGQSVVSELIVSDEYSPLIGRVQERVKESMKKYLEARE
jgi:hypothetical protein